MPVYKAEAIVLRQQALGESDRIVTLFTRENGKVRAVAKGVRRTTSRLGGRIEPFTHARLMLARGRTLDVIAQADIVRAFGEVRKDLTRAAHAAYVMELVDRGLPERDRHEDVFVLAGDALEKLDRCRAEDSEVVTLWFGLRLAGLLGYQPETAGCVECGRRLPRARGVTESWAFSLPNGGALCPTCRPHDPQAMSVSCGVLGACEYLTTAPEGQWDRLRITPAQRAELARLVQVHLEHRLEVRLRAPQVIRRLAEAPPA